MGAWFVNLPPNVRERWFPSRIFTILARGGRTPCDSRERRRRARLCVRHRCRVKNSRSSKSRSANVRGYMRTSSCAVPNPIAGHVAHRQGDVRAGHGNKAPTMLALSATSWIEARRPARRGRNYLALESGHAAGSFLRGRSSERQPGSSTSTAVSPSIPCCSAASSSSRSCCGLSWPSSGFGGAS